MDINCLLRDRAKLQSPWVGFRQYVLTSLLLRWGISVSAYRYVIVQHQCIEFFSYLNRLMCQFLRMLNMATPDILGIMIFGLMTGLVVSEMSPCYKVKPSSDCWDWSSCLSMTRPGATQLTCSPSPPSPRTGCVNCSARYHRRPPPSSLKLHFDLICRTLVSVLAGPGPLRTIRTIPVIVSHSPTSETPCPLWTVLGRDLKNRK